MSRANVWQKAYADSRYKRLGRAVGVTWWDALARCSYLWLECTLRQVHHLDVDEIDMLMDRDGFAAAMVAAGLAEETPEGLRIKGTVGKIEWFGELSVRGKAGADARWGRREDVSDPTDSMPEALPRAVPKAKPQPLPTALAPAMPPDPYPDLLPDPDPDPEDSGDLPPTPQGGVSRKKSAGKKPKNGGAHPGHTEAIAHFDALYRRANKGAKPTWGAKQGNQIRQLLAKHGLDEVKARTSVLFESPPDWLRRGGGALDLGTLVTHFDKLAPAAAKPRKVTPEELLARARAAELAQRGGR